MLTDDQVKATLRNAVAGKVIFGWYRHLPIKGREWVVNPNIGPCVSYDADGIREFCELLSCTGPTQERSTRSPSTGIDS